MGAAALAKSSTVSPANLLDDSFLSFILSPSNLATGTYTSGTGDLAMEDKRRWRCRYFWKGIVFSQLPQYLNLDN